MLKKKEQRTEERQKDVNSFLRGKIEIVSFKDIEKYLKKKINIKM